MTPQQLEGESALNARLKAVNNYRRRGLTADTWETIQPHLAELASRLPTTRMEVLRTRLWHLTEYLVWASDVASAVTKGTDSILDNVSHNRVFPVPDDPISRTLLLAIAPSFCRKVEIFL